MFVHLHFNYANHGDFTMLGSILKNHHDDEDYLIFDEWGRILGISEKTFNRIIMKDALSEFGMSVIEDHKRKKEKKLQELQDKVISKIAQDNKANLFKRALTAANKDKEKQHHDAPKRTYIKPSDIILKFGSIQHFIPQIGVIILELLAHQIIGQLQKESEQKMLNLGQKNEERSERQYAKMMTKCTLN